MKTVRSQHIIPVENGWCVKEFRISRNKIIRDKDEAIRKAAYRAEVKKVKLFLHFKNGKVEEVNVNWALKKSGLEDLAKRVKGKDKIRMKNKLINLRRLRPARNPR